MTSFYNYVVMGLTILFLTSFGLNAQINTPRGSQQATVSQTVGLSTIEIEYARPSVNGREIWGKLVPFGLNNLGFGTSTAAPWRAGANENTKITFSHDMSIGGKSIKAGTYGLHVNVKDMNNATILLSNNSTSWGSFFYDPAEDALSVDIATKVIPHTELLTFSFDEVTANSATAYLKWEKLAFPFKIDVPVADIVMTDIRNGMRDQAGFNRQTYEQAASFALNNGGDMNEALGWIENAIAGQFYSQKTFANLQIKSAILSQLGRGPEAMKLIDDNLDLGTVLEVHQLGRTLIGMGMQDKALEVFKYNENKNKSTWPVHYGLARGYSAKGDYKLALTHLQKAEANAPNAASKGRVAANIEKLKKGEDIN